MTVFAELNPPYRTIVADPPWSYDQRGVQGAVSREYSTLRMSDIAALPVAEVAAADAHLYLWMTNPTMFERPGPAEIMAAWGFTYKTTLTWVKLGPPGLGHYFRGNTEHVAFGVRGDCRIPAELRRRNVFEAPRRAHSQKPEHFFEIVHAVSPGPYLELFARHPRLGWDSWGKGVEASVA